MDNNNYNEIVNEYLATRKDIIITDDVILKYCNLASYYNRIFSESDIGDFMNKGSFEALFVSRDYIDGDFEFILRLLAKQTTGHVFHNANKRTATQLFLYFLNLNSPYEIKDKKDFIDLQNLLVNHSITEDDFIKDVKSCLQIKKLKLSDKVKLERLIPRTSVTKTNEKHNNFRPSFTIENLAKSNTFFKQLRKPFFQRDTNSWTVEKIETLLNSFIENMLIPSVIMWNSESDGIFIVDGAHRISALAAWANDDYGKSINFYKHIQIKKHIDDKIGNYNEIINSTSEKHMEIQNVLSTRAINIEWITGDYNLVKSSFVRINEQGVKIGKDEKEMIKNDQTTLARLCRGILSHTGGQNNLGNYDQYQKIYSNLFLPKYDKESQTTPMCGDINNDFIIARVFQLVSVIDSNRNLDLDELLKSTDEIVDIITNRLELNNRIYFYGKTYQYKPSALLGIVKFIMNLNNRKELNEFVKYRGDFEDYLIKNADHIQQIVRKSRQAKKSTEALAKYYDSVFEYVKTRDDSLLNKFNLGNKNVTERTEGIHKNYWTEISALKKCKYCKGYLNNYSMADEHAICNEIF